MIRDKIIDYIRSGEKVEKDYAIGFEIENFIVDENDKAVTYWDDGGVKDILEDLIKIGYEAVYVDDVLLGATKGETAISLEPGSQFELSIKKAWHIKELEDEYFRRMKEIEDIVHKRGYHILQRGYHVKTKIDEIKILPKERYDFMYKYFTETGTMGHNMMKGTAASQSSIDYKDEEDFRRKMRVYNALSPVFYAIFENANIFEGEAYKENGLRMTIWKNTDKERCSIIKEAFDDDFSYASYADYIVNRPCIFIHKDGDDIYTGHTKIKDIEGIDEAGKTIVEHVLSMFFPDTRAKKYIEIRMMDSVQIDYLLGLVALIKATSYQNLDKVYEMIKDVTYDDALKALDSFKESGIRGKLKDRSFLDIAKDLISLAKASLGDEAHYLNALEEVIDSGKSIREVNFEKYGL